MNQRAYTDLIDVLERSVVNHAHHNLFGTKVEGEWQLVNLAYNCKRLHRLMETMPG